MESHAMCFVSCWQGRDLQASRVWFSFSCIFDDGAVHESFALIGKGLYIFIPWRLQKSPKPWNTKGFWSLFFLFCWNNPLKKWRRRGFPWQDPSWFQVCCQSSCQGPQSKWFEDSRVQVWGMNVSGRKAMLICIPLYIIFLGIYIDEDCHVYYYVYVFLH